MFWVILNYRKKLVYLIKIIMAAAILIILITQLAGAIQQTGETYRRWINRDHPHGNPIKVFQNSNETIYDSRDPFLKKIKIHRENQGPVE